MMKTATGAALALATLAEAGYVETGIVPKIDSKSFWNNVADQGSKQVIGDKAWFIEMYAPWCPHCQKLAPTVDEFYQHHGEAMNVAKVDCTTTDGLELCQMFGVLGYPSLYFLPAGSDKHYKYTGDRSSRSFEQFTIEQGYLSQPGKPIGTANSMFEELMP